MSQRIDALLSQCGHGSRSEVRKRIRRGKVTVDGEVCKDAHLIVTDAMVVTYDGVRVERPQPAVPYLVHKPVGFTCRTKSDGPRVIDLLPEDVSREGVEPVPRLDDDASGLIVLTSEGAFGQRIVGPARRVAKRYRVRYRGSFPPDGAEKLAAGITLPDRSRPLRPCVWTTEEEVGGHGSGVLIRYETGADHIPEMLEFLGVQLTELHRDRVGTLDLPEDLPPGAARPLTETEREQVMAPDR